MIDVGRLRAAFDYDPLTGTFTWRVSPRSGIRPGDVAGHCSPKGYWRIGIDRKAYFAHRLAWLYVHGDCPEYIDHINRNPLDNRLSNLRPASISQNAANRAAIGPLLKGVTFHRQTGKFQASIKARGHSFYLGLYRTEAEAHQAYARSAAEKFGEFARAA